MWLLYAFSGPVAWAVSNHLDKYLLDKYFKDVSATAFLVLTSFMSLVLLPFIWFFVPGVLALPLSAKLLMALSGVLYMAGLLFYLWALQKDDVSVVSGLFQTIPLFGAALAFIFLGEVLSPAQLVAVGLIVCGSVLLSIRLGGMRVRTRTVLLMLAAALFIAMSVVIFKIFALQDAFWTTTFWMAIGEAAFGVAIAAVPSELRELRRMFAENTVPLLAINASNELINLGGSLGARYALLLAPLGLVQAIASTTPAFVLLFSVLLWLFFPSLGKETFTRGNLLQKILGIAGIVVGTILISA